MQPKLPSQKSIPLQDIPPVSSTPSTRSTVSHTDKAAYASAKHAMGSHTLMRDYFANIARLVPWDSLTQKPWTEDKISRVIIKNISRDFNLDSVRDVQDIFVLLLRQRANDAQIKLQVEVHTREEWTKEQRELRQLELDNQRFARCNGLKPRVAAEVFRPPLIQIDDVVPDDFPRNYVPRNNK